MPPYSLRSSLSFPETRRFEVDGGGTLTIYGGEVRCRVTFFEHVLGPASLIAAGRPASSIPGLGDEDGIRAALEVPDSAGHVYRMERLLRSTALVNLVRVSQPAREPTRVLLEGIYCLHDTRCALPAIGVDGSVFAYRGKHVSLTIDLLCTEVAAQDRLVVRVRPTRGAAIDDRATPEVLVENLWAARVVLDPDLLGRTVCTPGVLTRRRFASRLPASAANRRRTSDSMQHDRARRRAEGACG